MVIEIDRFKSAVSAGDGFAQSNMFVVEIPTFPFDTISMNTINLLCKSAQLPGRQILTSERTVGVKPVKQAYGYLDNDDIALSFHVMNDFKIKTFFERWQSLAYDTTTERLNYYNDYVRDVTIKVLRRDKQFPPITKTFQTVSSLFNVFLPDNDFPQSLLKSSSTVYQCQLLDAFPTTMQAIDLNNEQNGMIELNVQLSFRKWRTV